MGKQYRTHQQDTKRISQDIVAARKLRFRALLHVVCGGGKSWLPAILMESMPVNLKLCWVVPRLALQSQAVKGTAKDFGLILRDSGNDVDPCRGRRGVVVTHQAVTQSIDLWVQEFRRNKYILVIDEPHHAKVFKNGEKNALAKFIEAVEPYAAGVVYMTGTLSTSDSSKIYGIEYELNVEGKESPTYSGFDYVVRYKREDGLRESALVPIEFFHHDGPVKWECLKSGETTEVMLSEAERCDESSAIWTALSTELAESLFERGYAHWKANGNKLLVVCDSQSNAKKWHEELLRRGEKVFLAISENEDALKDIEKFKSATRSCLVTCAMAYEGLDEKPLSHVISLTHIRSVPWIEQMLARVWRADEGKSTCYAFVTDDPRMRRVIDKIKSEEPDAKSSKVGSGGDGPGERSVAPVESRHEITRVSGLDHESQYPEMNIQQQQAYEALISLGIDPSDEHFCGIIQQLATVTSEPLEKTLSDKEAESELRAAIKDKCSKIDREKFDCKWGSMYRNLYKVNGKPIDRLNLDQLRRTYSYVESILTR
jgi:superfamily II DNA or RNA helicase